MNTIVIYTDHGKWVGFESKGHIGQYDESTGEYSLVCSALSMHLQTIAYSLEKHLDSVEMTRDDEDGYLKVLFKGESPLLAGIEAVFLNGISLIETDYKKYLKVHNEEVEYYV